MRLYGFREGWEDTTAREVELASGGRIRIEVVSLYSFVTGFLIVSATLFFGPHEHDSSE